MNWHIVKYQNHPAVTCGYTKDLDTPTESRSLWYNPKVAWNEEYYTQFGAGQLLGNDCFLFATANSQYMKLNTAGWLCVNESIPLKTPGRGGKNWRWVWGYGNWRKESTNSIIS